MCGQSVRKRRNGFRKVPINGKVPTYGNWENRLGMEGGSDVHAAEQPFHFKAAEIHRPEQVPASGTNRYKWRLG